MCSALHVLRVALSESPQAVADRSNGKSSCPQIGECYFTVGQADLFSPCTMRWLALFAGILRGACANHGEKVTGTGAWKIPAGFRYNLDSSFADGIAAVAGLNASLLDVGAGKGLYVRYLRAHGLRANGVEGVENIAALTGGLVRQQDLTKPMACEPNDLVMCLEVGEHIPWPFQYAFLRNLNCSTHPTTGRLVLTWAPPGQYGSGHVNNRPASAIRRWLTSNHSCQNQSGWSGQEVVGCDWQQQLPGFGFEFDAPTTQYLRELIGLGYFRANALQVFRRPSAPPATLLPIPTPRRASNMTTVAVRFLRRSHAVASAMAAEAMGLMPPKEHYDSTGRVGIGAVSRELRNIESHLALLSSLERREMEAG